MTATEIMIAAHKRGLEAEVGPMDRHGFLTVLVRVPWAAEPAVVRDPEDLDWLLRELEARIS